MSCRLIVALIYTGMILPSLLFPAPADAWVCYPPSIGRALGVQL